MTEIVVSRRDGIVTAPDGTKYRIHRGKTLADARHPAVVAHPRDWTPMHVELTVPGSDPTGAAGADVDDLRNELAEVEEQAEQRGAELLRLVDALRARGVTLPPEDEQVPGWVVDLTLSTLDGVGPATAAPRPPRRRGGKPGVGDAD